MSYRGMSFPIPSASKAASWDKSLWCLKNFCYQLSKKLKVIQFHIWTVHWVIDLFLLSLWKKLLGIRPSVQSGIEWMLQFSRAEEMFGKAELPFKWKFSKHHADPVSTQLQQPSIKKILEKVVLWYNTCLSFQDDYVKK